MNELEAQSTVVEADNSGPQPSLAEEGPPNPHLKRRATFKDKLSPSRRRDKAHAASFVTAPMKPRGPSKSKLGSISPANSHRPSFVTADETPEYGLDVAPGAASGSAKKSPLTQCSPLDTPPTPSGTQPRSSNIEVGDQGHPADSKTNLLSRSNTENANSPSTSTPPQVPPSGGDAAGASQTKSHGMVRFNVNNHRDNKEKVDVAEVGPVGRRKIWRRLRRGSSHPGEIVKIEKMLVRVDSTMQELPLDYNENDSLKTETRTVEKWREFVVVCRESTTEDADFSIQMYKTRVIPSKENTHVKKKSTYEIPLARKSTRVNLYSSLDKTLVIWAPGKVGTRIYILRTHSVASAVEWNTFLRHTLGSYRTTTLQINVPDLSVTLQLDNPFEEIEAAMTRSSMTDDARMTDTMDAERAVANNIIQRSLSILKNNPEWADVLQSWLSKEKMGLAWKRYDRLEWIHGANEQRMYGTLGMLQTHDLELRPKDHYPTSIKHKQESMDEPAPVEGFLIRLTSQKGRVRRLGKMYYKRLYFTTHNHFLCYCRPAKALPPPPPKLSLARNAEIPSTSKIVDESPLIYAVNPYPNKDGQVEWLQHGNPTNQSRHDDDAYKEAERKVNSLLQAEGYINLSHVVHVRNAEWGSSPADANVDQGPDVNFHEEVADTRADDGKTDQFDDKRTLELVLKNNLIVRLQAYNETTKKEWITRLRKLVHYWKLRLTNDMDMLKAVRRLNLERLEIDEESEAHIGQFGSKWEVTRSIASPKLFNTCGISCCRAITVGSSLSLDLRQC